MVSINDSKYINCRYFRDEAVDFTSRLSLVFFFLLVVLVLLLFSNCALHHKYAIKTSFCFVCTWCIHSKITGLPMSPLDR